MSPSTSSSNGKERLAEYDAVFAALDNPARRQILMILHIRRDQMTSGEIADRFACKWPTTSRHLRRLESSGLVTVERAGREWIYKLNRARLGLVTEWLEWFARPVGVEPAGASAPRARGMPAQGRRAGGR